MHAAGAANIRAMIENGKAFFARKYPDMKYLAYFQSYTNTHGASEKELLGLYRSALAVNDVVGLIISTRPDCVSDSLLDALAQINRDEAPVIMEYGAESSHNSTLAAINRCHTWETTVDAVLRTADRNLSVGLHFIMGLPGETEEMMLATVQKAVSLPIGSLKFHQLQIIRGTHFAEIYKSNPDYFNLFTPDAYAALCRKIIDIVAPADIAIERFVAQAPDEMLVAPRWGLKNYQFANLLNKKS